MDLSLFEGLSWSALGGFALTSVLIELTPGPNMLTLAVIAASKGRKLGYAAVAGVALGLLIMGVAAAVGLGAAVSASPVLYQALRWGGVAYLLWLAYDGWVDAGQDEDLRAGSDRVWHYFKRGLIINLLNPKAAIFYIAVLPNFIVTDAPILMQTVVLSLTYVAVATVVHATIVTLAGLTQRLLQDPRRSQMIRRILALALAGVALWFGWQTGR